MKEQNEVLRETQSLCPVCLRRLPARHVCEDGNVYMEKNCPEHGNFRTILWRGGDDFPMDVWRGDIPALSDKSIPCPEACGLCSEHLQETCCILLELTRRCNLHCRHCFAEDDASTDPPFETVKKWLADLSRSGRALVQLSGGEPTLRDDLPKIVACAKERGVRYVQLNSNGLRLAEDESYVAALANAGLSFVFMQFDGISDDIYHTLRGRPLLDTKLRAVKNCAKYGIGVTFACTVVPGVNIDGIGALIDLAVSLSPAVRGVHFQPVSYFGRYPEPPTDSMRFTLPELMREIVSQSGGRIAAEHLAPSRCDHPVCSFHGDFVVLPDGLRSLGRAKQTECCCVPPVSSCCEREHEESAADKNRHFVARRWERSALEENASCCEGSSELVDLTNFDGFLDRVRSHGFTLTAMAFQDCWNIDLERLMHCSLHVYVDGKIIPFCARYLTPQS